MVALVSNEYNFSWPRDMASGLAIPESQVVLGRHGERCAAGPPYTRCLSGHETVRDLESRIKLLEAKYIHERCRDADLLLKHTTCCFDCINPPVHNPEHPCGRHTNMRFLMSPTRAVVFENHGYSRTSSPIHRKPVYKRSPARYLIQHARLSSMASPRTP